MKHGERMKQETNASNRRNAYFSILLLGIVSLMGDFVYEGSRGLVPSYLGFLGATAVVVGLVGGVGDFLGYSLRLVSGFLADTTHAYWLFIFIGYGLIVSIPLLGIQLGLGIAIILVLLERFGKAFRLKIIAKDNEYYCAPIDSDNFNHRFDMAGLLHTMNNPKWGVVVFDNFWFAYAYEQKLKQEKQNERADNSN